MFEALKVAQSHYCYYIVHQNSLMRRDLALVYVMNKHLQFHHNKPKSKNENLSTELLICNGSICWKMLKWI